MPGVSSSVQISHLSSIKNDNRDPEMPVLDVMGSLSVVVGEE